MSDKDELAEIDGIKPNVYLQDGAEQEVTSTSRYANHPAAPDVNFLNFNFINLVRPNIRLSEPGTIIIGENCTAQADILIFT